MNPFKKLAAKLSRPPEAAPPPGRPLPVPSFMKMPDGLMQELFPGREVMVSAIFAEKNAAGAPLPADTALPPELPKAEPQGMIATPDELSISDEMRAAIFPPDRVMVSVVFAEPVPTPPAPEPDRRHRTDDSDGRHDYPIV